MNILTSPIGSRAPKSDGTEIDPNTLPEPRATFIEQLGVFLGVFVPFVALIAGIVLLWGRAVGWLDLTLMLGMYSVTVIGITVGYHRLLTHKSFETYPFMRFLLAGFGSMSLQGPVLQWCGVHRRHHQQSDRPGDPHSPHQHGDGFFGFLRGMWHSHMGWLFEPTDNGLERSIPDLLNDKAVRLADRTFWYWVVGGLVFPTLVGGLVTHSWHGAATAFMWGGLVRMCLMHHATFSINSVCHLWGSRPFKNTDESRNNPIFGVVSFGEGWHNNHHAFPTSARHGLKWWQLDISWLFIQTLKVLHLAWDVRVPNESAMNSKLRKRPAVAAPSAA